MYSSSRALLDPSGRQPSIAATHSLHGDAEALHLLVASVGYYAIFMLDPQGNILTWNLGAERIKGYTALELIGKHFSLFYTRKDSVAACSAGINQGSEFTIRPPTLHHALARHGPNEPTVFVAAQRTYCLLVVGDNRDAAETLAELLTDLGHTVAVAHDGEAALEKAYEEPTPDAVLLDIGLPRLNGYEVAQRLRGTSASGSPCSSP